MEPINGLQVLSLLRRGSVRGIPRDTKVILITSHADEALVKTAIALDVDGYFVKPIGKEGLAKVLADTLSRPPAIKSAKHYADISVPNVRREREKGSG